MAQKVPRRYGENGFGGEQNTGWEWVEELPKVSRTRDMKKALRALLHNESVDVGCVCGCLEPSEFTEGILIRENCDKFGKYMERVPRIYHTVKGGKERCDAFDSLATKMWFNMVPKERLYVNWDNGWRYGFDTDEAVDKFRDKYHDITPKYDMSVVCGGLTSCKIFRGAVPNYCQCCGGYTSRVLSKGFLWGNMSIDGIKTNFVFIGNYLCCSNVVGISIVQYNAMYSNEKTYLGEVYMFKEGVYAYPGWKKRVPPYVSKFISNLWARANKSNLLPSIKDINPPGVILYYKKGQTVVRCKDITLPKFIVSQKGLEIKGRNGEVNITW